jgi:hypothetical protein
LRELRSPPARDLRGACRDLFAARADEATQAGAVPRAWPPTAVAFAHWRLDYSRAAREAGLDIGLDEGIATINDWILDIEATTT